MTRQAVLALLIACFACPSLADDKPDVTGTWVCNMGKSKVGKMPKIDGMTLKVTRNGEVLHSVQSFEDGTGGGGKNIEGDWFMDGKVHPVDPNATVNKMTSMSKWEGNTLVAQRRSEDGSFVEDIRIVFSNGNKTATERVSTKSPNGNNASTLVWERK